MVSEEIHDIERKGIIEGDEIIGNPLVVYHIAEEEQYADLKNGFVKYFCKALMIIWKIKQTL